ncbi:hypothetical protein K438DRAFT_1850805 [Mycena galopus ATCC 62051]|nr:hypothetical protein K438DRAFT_1872046 [Mycena galopus ATCC 62051]KAF8173255.1 hypothetical protein K438DRAFT_1850805 [Mycena galopus ATCC 62051]
MERVLLSTLHPGPSPSLSPHRRRGRCPHARLPRQALYRRAADERSGGRGGLGRGSCQCSAALHTGPGESCSSREAEERPGHLLHTPVPEDAVVNCLSLRQIQIRLHVQTQTRTRPCPPLDFDAKREMSRRADLQLPQTSSNRLESSSSWPGRKLSSSSNLRPWDLSESSSRERASARASKWRNVSQPRDERRGSRQGESGSRESSWPMSVEGGIKTR